jgi:hypothetical protein
MHVFFFFFGLPLPISVIVTLDSALSCMRSLYENSLLIRLVRSMTNLKDERECTRSPFAWYRFYDELLREDEVPIVRRRLGGPVLRLC